MLRNKWTTDQAYIDLLELIKKNISDKNLGITKENGDSLPSHVVSELGTLAYTDLSGIDLSHLSLKGSSLAHTYLYKSNFMFTYFYDVVLQWSFAKEANFSHAHFQKTQGIPFYAPKANFENSIFENCMIDSHGNYNDYVSFVDLTDCNFKNTQFYKCEFGSVVFKQSNFDFSVIENTVFEIAFFNGVSFYHTVFNDCRFESFIAEGLDKKSPRDRITDFRGAEFKNTRFENCTFDTVFFDDDPEIKQMILSGNNINTEAIVWVAKDADAKK